MPKITNINILAFLVICIFAAIYLTPITQPEQIALFALRYADPILLAFMIIAISIRLLTSDKALEPLFWYLIGAAFLSWFCLTLMRLYFFDSISPATQGFVSEISYFIYYAMMISAIEIKSYATAHKFFNQRNFISSISLLSFLIGSFAYLILLPHKPDVNHSIVYAESFYFYILMDSYLVIRWWHIAWQVNSRQRLGFFLLGLANASWLLADAQEYSLFFINQQNHGLWYDWIWYLPYFLFFAGMQKIAVRDPNSEKNGQLARYHLFNSPIFFLGIISLLFLILSDNSSDTTISSVKNLQVIWLVITLALSLFQLLELFDTNKRRKFELQEVKTVNKDVNKQLIQMQQKLESQASGNQIILDSISNPIFTLDLNGVIQTCNLATENFLGYKPEQLVGYPFSKVVAIGEELNRYFDYQSYRQKLMKNNTGLELESKIVSATGEVILMHATLSQGVGNSRNIIVVSLTDIRQQKLAEKQLHQLKDDFTANISHEFRTPLTIVNGIIEELAENQEDPMVSEQLQIAQRNNQRLIHMVDQLLELSRVASKSLPLSDIDASDWIEPICLSYKTIAKDREIDYVISICQPILIHGNQQALENILYNLVSNAFKYTKKSGAVTVSLEERNEDYQLMVVDTGIGISKDDQANIFDRFQRSHIDSQHAIPGVGIGLSLVKDLVNSMGWEISLISHVNKGSKFIVNIKKAINNKLVAPTTKDTSEDRKTAIVDPVSLLSTEIDHHQVKSRIKSKYLVLIIEDNLDMQSHLENILSPHHQCLVASNGSQGISMAEEFLPDIVLSDVMMPGISGFEVLEKLKTSQITTHIPVIMLTAKSDQKSKLKGLSGEADDYIGKPFNAEELVLKIENQFKMRKKLQQKYEIQWQGFTKKDAADEGEIIEDTFLSKLNSIFEENYSQVDFSSHQLADELAMSERQLQRKVKALVDVTPLELLKRFRLEKAKVELKNDVQVGIAAQSSGFSSQTYFGRCFKEHFGITPKAYKTSIPKDSNQK